MVIVPDAFQRLDVSSRVLLHSIEEGVEFLQVIVVLVVVFHLALLVVYLILRRGRVLEFSVLRYPVHSLVVSLHLVVHAGEENAEW